MLLSSLSALVALSILATLKTFAIEIRMQELYPYGKILNGEKATRSQFPFQVSIDGCSYCNTLRLRYRSCGGSIISEEYILTSAHCTYKVNNLKVVLATLYYMRGSKYNILSENVFIHPGYNPAARIHGISLIKIPKQTFYGNLVF